MILVPTFPTVALALIVGSSPTTPMGSSKTEKDFQAIEERIRRFQIEYDCFLAGSRDRPPLELQEEIEALFAKYKGRSFRRYADGFRYNSLLGSYTVYRELYEKRLRQRERGTDSQTLQRESRLPIHSNQESGSNATPDPDQSLQQLYQQYVHAKRENGDSVQALTLERFRQAIEKKTRDISQKMRCRSIRFRIQVQEGEVKVLANPVKG